MSVKTVSTKLLSLFKANAIIEEEQIQMLWSGYGQLSRFLLSGGEVESIIVKKIVLPTQSNHPRGWNTNRSHNRKMKSYQVEMEWYRKWAKRCTKECRVPKCYYADSIEDNRVLILEDLDAGGFAQRKNSLNISETKVVLKWLANFHANFMNEIPDHLWAEGTYWHLSTRPDEWDAMGEGSLKSNATEFDHQLRNCNYQTIVHGDAKVANFCFSNDMKQVAAVDFQYVGGGCGMKDVVYFMGSCLSEIECERYEEELLEFYFSKLKDALRVGVKQIDLEALEKEWRLMYTIAWADFMRFLMGWMPTHQKIHSYSQSMVEKALKQIN